MTTRDPFLDALTIKPGIQTYWGDTSESVYEPEPVKPVARFPLKPPPAAPKPTPPIAPQGNRDPSIDAMIAQWMADGELILDVELDSYRVPRRRKWRYGSAV